MKKISVILLCVLLVFSIAACGNEAPPSPQPDPAPQQPADPGDPDPQPADPVDPPPAAGGSIVVGIWGGNDTEMAGMDQMKENFEALTGIDVEYRLYTDYNTQIQADFIAGTAPDVFYVDVNMFPFFNSIGVLEPLDSAAVNADAFFTNLTDGFTSGGTLFAVPKDFSTVALYVNTGILDDLGLTLADIPGSYEGLLDWLPALQGNLDDLYGAGEVVGLTFHLEMARNLHLLARGTSLIDDNDMPTLNTPAAIDNFQLFLDLTDTGSFKRPSDVGAGWNGESFGLGKALMIEEGNWVYGYINNEFPDINFIVTDMPSYKGSQSSMIFTVGWGIYSQSANKDAALEWVKYATGVEGMSNWAGPVGVLPSRQDVADNINLAANPDMQAHLAQVRYAMPWQLGLYSSIISDQYGNFATEAITGGMSAADAMTAAQDQAVLQIG